MTRRCTTHHICDCHAERMRELEAQLQEREKRAVLEKEAAAQLCEVYFAIAERHMTEDEIRAARDSMMAEAVDFRKRAMAAECRLDSLLDGIRGVLTDWPHGEAMQQNAALLALVTPVVERSVPPSASYETHPRDTRCARTPDGKHAWERWENPDTGESGMVCKVCHDGYPTLG